MHDALGLAAVSVRPPRVVRVLALLGTVATVLVGAALMLSEAVDGPSGGSLILIVVGAATIA